MIKRDRKKLNVIGVIQARGGSKGVPKKNIRPLGGTPLIAYSIMEAKKSRYLDRIIVSTEDQEIARIAKKYDAEVVALPAEFATDTAAHEPGLINVITELKEKENFRADILIMLQATTPFRKAATIDAALEKLVAHPTADSVVSVYDAPHKFNPRWISIIDKNGLLKPYAGDTYLPVRQQLPKVYWRDGQVYAVYAQALLATGSRYGGNGTLAYLNSDDPYRINIDSELDFLLAETLIEKGWIKL